MDAPADSGQLLNLTSSRRSEQKMWASLNENVIRAVVGGPDGMADCGPALVFSAQAWSAFVGTVTGR
ncbi:DUF397 domain-containing protein [Streptomyces sp. DT24]|uniref:DUF397 domain-containing protein n=1 Tax=Streptomyces sp. DT24 TaxID=3416520 RepID=UPI003CF2C7FC